MSYIFEQTIGKYRYVYEGTSFRDENGNVRTTRTPIGKVDPNTSQRIYKPEYIERMRAAGTPLTISSTQKQFSIDDIERSEIKECGMTHLLRCIAERDGLLETLQSCFPDIWAELFMLACFLIVTGDPFVYCEEWIKSAESLPVGSMSSQRVSELLAAIEQAERERFYAKWCSFRCEREYLALDITSTSSYSELIEDVEWGYNRDHEELPQINICLLMGEQSMLPIYQTVYNGSIRDVSTLEATLAEFRSVAGDRPILAVMDKGFYSKGNVEAMLGGQGEHRFIVSAPFTASFAKRQVDGERKDIDSLNKTIVVNGDSMRAITQRRAWNSRHEVYTHIYFNAKKAFGIREALYANITLLKEEAEANPARHCNSEEHTKYLNIRKSAHAPSGYTVSIREDVAEKEIRTSGWVVVISNDVADAKRAMQIYRAKDVVEKGFWRLKRNLDLGRLRVHSEHRMLNKVFVGFIALILLSELNKTMSEKKLYRTMTMQQLIRSLSKLKIIYVAGTRIMRPASKEQRSIFDAFNVTAPV
jgi:transposase